MIAKNFTISLGDVAETVANIVATSIINLQNQP